MYFLFQFFPLIFLFRIVIGDQMCSPNNRPNKPLTLPSEYSKPFRFDSGCWLMETRKHYFITEPAVKFAEALTGAKYTLMFTGYTEFIWLISNIPGEDLKKGDLSRGKVLHHFVALDTTHPKGEKYIIKVHKQLVDDISGDYEEKLVQDFRADWLMSLCPVDATLCFYN